MTINVFKAADRGATFRPRNFRVYRAAVRTSASGRPGWDPETPQAFWQPLSLEWSANGRPSTLTLRRVLGSGESKAAERVEWLGVSAGDRFRLAEARLPTGAGEMFRGYVGQGSLVVQASPDFEGATIVAYGPEILLAARAVTGAWYMTPQADDAEISGTATDATRVRANVFATNLPAIFNKGGRPNASTCNWSLTGEDQDERHCAVFTAPGRTVHDADGTAFESRYWDAYTAVRSLVEWLDNGEVISHSGTDWEAIEPIASVPIGEVNVTGLSLADAMLAVLRPAGLGFAVEPWANRHGKHRLRVFSLHGGRGRPGPFLGRGADDIAADGAEGRRCSVQRLAFTRDNHRVANDVVVVGDRKRREVSLEFGGDGELRACWDSGEDDLDDYATDGSVAHRSWTAQQYRDFCEKYTYGLETCRKHAFRSFAWNEDGAMSPIIEEIPDLSGCGVGGQAVRRPRPVGERLAFDNSGRVLPAAVQLAIDGDENSWIQVPAHIWTDRAGFTLTRRTLHDWHPYATDAARGVQTGSGTLYDEYGDLSYLQLLYNTLNGVSGQAKLKLRLTGTVETDDCVTGRAAYNQDGSWPFRTERIVFAPNRFKWRDAGCTDGDNVDDSEIAAGYAAAVRDVLEDATGHGSIILRGIDRSWHVGDAISSTRGRRISLRIRGRGIDDAQSFSPVVTGIVWNFEAGVAKTELVLESPLLQVTR